MPGGPEPGRADPIRAVLEPGPSGSALSEPSRPERSRSGSLGSVRVKGPKANPLFGPVWPLLMWVDGCQEGGLVSLAGRQESRVDGPDERAGTAIWEFAPQRYP